MIKLKQAGRFPWVPLLALLLLCGACAAPAGTAGTDPAPELSGPAEAAEPVPLPARTADPVPPETPAPPAETPEPPGESAEAKKILEKLEPWYERNPYLAVWLRTEDGSIDDPVLYTPGDQNFFLQRDFDGNEAVRGTLFLAIPWREGNNHALIYGHNMADGSRFGSLHLYTDEAYGKAHPTLSFDTLHEEARYELLAAFYSEIYDVDDIETEDDRAEKNAAQGAWSSLAELELTAEYPDHDIYREQKDIQDSCFRYYYYTDLSDPQDFAYYVEQVKASSLYDTGVDAVWGDRLLTLSTCSWHKPNGRLVVVARMRPE